MKLNKISLVFAAMALVGCSSEDVSDFSANQTIDENGLVQLSPNFVIAGVGQDDATTRTHWELVGGALKNKFLPIYAVAPGGASLDNYFDLNEEAVGLCWLGQTPDEKVYTNYQFYHYGWLNNGQTKAEFECNQLMNGWLYNEIDVAAGDAAGDEADPADFAANVAKAIPFNPNYNTGIYKTENKAIFGGQYIVYYPYNQDFKNAGTIPAVAKTTWNNVSIAFDTPEIGKYTFRYSAPVTIEGGDQAADFGLYNLSTLVQLRVACPAGNAAIGETIDQIVLYSPSQQLLKQANLAADKIAAWQTGTDLYASTEGIKTISANFAAPVALAATTGAVTSAYITVLPTTVEDLVVLVHNSTTSKWAKVNMPNTVFEAGTAKRMDITVAAADFKSEYIAVDEASLINARNEARLAGGGNVTIIGDITLVNGANNPYDFNTDPSDPLITYTGDAIIVPEDVTLNTATNWESDIRVLGKSCCTGTNGAVLTIWGGTLSNVTMVPTEDKAPTAAKNPTVNYNWPATIAAGKTFDAQAGTINVNAAVQHKGDINIAEGVTLTVNAGGDLNFMGSTVVNDGTIEVKQNGKFDMTDADGNATATDGKRMTNNGKFIHNVDAGVGTAVQSMNQNGEYRCRVNDQIKLSDAYLQWLACSVIEIVDGSATGLYNLGVGDGVGYKHNGKFIDIEVNTPTDGVMTFNNPMVSGTNGDSKTIQTGKLTVTAGGLDVDFVQGTGKRSLIVNGDMVAKAATTFTDSKAITLKENLTVQGAVLIYAGAKKNEGGLAVTKDITVDGGGTFNASALNALNITSANFYLKAASTAIFGNRDSGDAHNLDVTGTISNPAGCTFNILPAAGGNVLAWVTCSQLIVGGNWGAARPRVQ